MNQLIIYRIYHIETHKSYIGKCSKGLSRVKEHFRDFKNPKKEYRAKLLYRAMKKYGADEFKYEILDQAHSIEELNQKEKEYIVKFDSRNPKTGYNIRPGGDGGDTYTYLSEEEKIIRSKNLSKGIKKSYTNERRHKCSDTLSKTRKDPNKSSLNAKIASERMKILNSDPDFRIKSKRNKPVKCIETGQIFSTSKDLAAFLSMSPSTVNWLISKKNGLINGMTYVRIET
ncbi:MAG: hypothetical protein HC840_00785 [Leptolyngbyaceae cyanobacterium RM2_2_4]|nr:hypothetical protein [Leptolyngbyaceae cyanobacterium RM2_2_4]